MARSSSHWQRLTAWERRPGRNGTQKHNARLATDLKKFDGSRPNGKWVGFGAAHRDGVRPGHRPSKTKIQMQYGIIPLNLVNPISYRTVFMRCNRFTLHLLIRVLIIIKKRLFLGIHKCMWTFARLDEYISDGIIKYIYF